jgi:Domain of unknown function (DUF4355)
LRSRETEVTIRENRADAISKFAELQLPIKLVDFVVDTDKLKMDEKINSFKDSWNAALNDAVKAKLAGNGAPPDPTNSSSGKDPQKPTSAEAYL